MLLEILFRMQHRTGFEQRHVDAKIRQDLGDSTASRAGTDNHHVRDRGATHDLRHATIISRSDWGGARIPLLSFTAKL